MTDAELEAACRRYCGLLGIDPDEKVECGVQAVWGAKEAARREGWAVMDVLLIEPRWRLYRRTIEEAALVMQALGGEER